MFDKLKSGTMRFMAERYGNDALNISLFLFALIITVINIFLNNFMLTLISEGLVIYVLFRTLSKNRWARQQENYAFLESTRGIRNSFKLFRNNISDKDHKYMMCPNCKQMVRVPSGRGKITVHCPKCHNRFDAKS